MIYLKNEASLSSSPPEVTVHVQPSSSQGVHSGLLILILHAQRPVHWRVVAERIATVGHQHHTIVVTGSSQLIENRDLPVVVSNRQEKVIGRVITWVTKRFRAVTSYAEVTDSNNIFLKVGVAENAPEECNLDGKMTSPNVEALLTEIIPTNERAGCLVATSREFQRPEVHVIHVRSEIKVPDEIFANDSSLVATLPPPQIVVVEVRPRYSQDVENNMILVLKAHQRVIWQVRSERIRGALKIVTEDPVERSIVPTSHLIHVKTEELPVSTDALIFYADNKYGPLLSYLEVNKANKFTVFTDDESIITEFFTETVSSTSPPPPPMLISPEVKMPRQTNWPLGKQLPPNMPSPKDFIKAQLGTIRSSRLTGVQVLVKSKGRINPEDLLRMPNVLLMDAMQVDCLPQHIQISFPRLTLEHLGLQGGDTMTLNDPKCKVLANDTHYYFDAYFKECGTDVNHASDRIVYKNAVNFHFRAKKVALGTTSSIIRESDLLVDDEDHGVEGGSGTQPRDEWAKKEEASKDADALSKPKTLEFQCEYLTMDPSSIIPIENSNIVSPHWQIYGLDLYRDQDYRSSVKSDDFPVNVIENERLYVESRIDAGPNLRVVTEQCWLSNSSDSSSEDVRVPLLRNTCPAGLSVQLERVSAPQLGLRPMDDSADAPAVTTMRQWNHFSFQAGSEYLKYGALYLHCTLGVCSVNLQHTAGNLKKCLNLEEFCLSNSLRPYLDRRLGTNHEILTRGPIHVIPKPTLQEKTYQDLLSSLAPFLARDKKPDANKALVDVESRGNDRIQDSPQIILIGLSTEAVVGIAFASFVIGAGLTAILWFIHLRTDPLRNARSCANAPHHSGYDLSAHSGSSTPSSQVPMTT